MVVELSALLPFIGIGIVVGISYSLFNYFTSINPDAFEVKRFVASVLFGALIGFIGGYSTYSAEITPEDVEWWGLMATLFLSYTGAQVYVNKFTDYIWYYLFGVKVGATAWFYDKWVTESVPEITEEEKTTKLAYLISAAGEYYRKMSESRRHNMVFDQPAQIQPMILDCVDAAEAKLTWRYVIAAGAWEYLIEAGVLTGAKHYWYFKSGKVQWKPISVNTLETIRSTGKWPDYSKLT